MSARTLTPHRRPRGKELLRRATYVGSLCVASTLATAAGATSPNTPRTTASALASPPARLESAGSYSIHGTAAKGTIKVSGRGKFDLKDDGSTLVFTSAIGRGKPHLDMGERQDHTRKHFALSAASVVTLSVPKAGLSFPEPGKTVSGTASGKLEFGAGEQPVRVQYKARGAAGAIVVEQAEFTFDYTIHRAKKEPICLALICVAETIGIRASNFTVKAN